MPHIEHTSAGMPRGNSSTSFARIAFDFLRSGQPLRAVEVCQAGLRNYPRYSTGRLVLGKAYRELGRNVEAMLEFRKVLRAFPDNVTVRNLLKEAEERTDESYPTHQTGSPVTLHDGADGGKRLQQKFISATLAEIYAKQGAYQEAIAIYRKLIELRPVDGPAYTKRIIEFQDIMFAQQPERNSGIQ